MKNRSFPNLFPDIIPVYLFNIAGIKVIQRTLYNYTARCNEHENSDFRIFLYKLL